MVIDPLLPSRRRHIATGGAGSAATALETVKRQKYADIDKGKYMILPFVVETTGAFGDAAKSLCHQFNERRNAFASRKRRLRPSSTNRLMSRISAELQKSNAGMISIRRPPPIKLQVEKLAKIDLRIEKVSAKAKAHLLTERPASLRNPIPRHSPSAAVPISGPQPPGPTPTISLPAPQPPDPQPKPPPDRSAPYTHPTPISSESNRPSNPPTILGQSDSLAISHISQQKIQAVSPMALDDDQVDDEKTEEPHPLPPNLQPHTPT